MASSIVPALKKANAGVAVVCSAATWPRHAVNRDAVVPCSSSLSWDGDCKTYFVSFSTAVPTLSIQG